MNSAIPILLALGFVFGLRELIKEFTVVYETKLG